MGTWGVKSFDNDTAMDWIYDLEESSNFEFITKTLKVIIASTSELDSDECQEAIAAAEVIAAMIGNPADELPNPVRSWVKKHKEPPSKELIILAHQAMEKIAESSELQALWAETEEFITWSNETGNLLYRLRRSLP